MKDYKTLVQEAIKSLETVHKNQPEKLRYGSAVLTKSGKIFSAANYWSYTASLVLHAEQAALAHAAAHGENEIVAIVSVSTEGDEGDFCGPCGMCRQLIYEKSFDTGIDIDVVMASLNGEYEIKKISGLMPFPWPEKVSK